MHSNDSNKLDLASKIKSNPVVSSFAAKNNIDLSLFHSNIEGELVETIQEARKEQHGYKTHQPNYN